MESPTISGDRYVARQRPQGLNRLSALAITNATAIGGYADGGGLYLEVGGNGRKRWAMRITINGRRREGRARTRQRRVACWRRK